MLVSLAEAVRALSVLLTPYMPASTEILLRALSATSDDYADAVFADTGRGCSVAELAPLFPKR